ncbi:MAG: metalloregulator ArsR/SmtB family transcription factor [Bacillota bacterium]|jgi:ArsR family transcriptional regulator|nr:metalloregulator ArsR/SmtB family transcription factor [Bacillota bacterium]HHT89599.1 helix-turn-helix transcriptional regulator [Bacillota bacterium]
MTEQSPCCEVTVIHEDRVKQVRQNMPPEENLFNLAELFKVFGDTTRIRILYTLFQSEMCVCDIAYLLDMTQSAISHQLRVLKGAKLVRYRKEGRVVYYSLDDEHIKAIFDQGYQHIQERN